MLILRILSGLFLLAAAIALISEATRAQLGVPGAPFTPLLTQLAESTPVLLRSVEKMVRNLHGYLWDPSSYPFCSCQLGQPRQRQRFSDGLVAAAISASSLTN